MCLDIVMEKHPKKNLFIGYKCYKTNYNIPLIEDTYTSEQYKYNTWYIARTNERIEPTFDSIHNCNNYKSGFHIWINPIHAALYRNREQVAIVKVYFEPSDIMTIGSNECGDYSLTYQSLKDLFKLYYKNTDVDSSFTNNRLRFSGPTVISKRMYIPQQKPLIINKVDNGI